MVAVDDEDDTNAHGSYESTEGDHDQSQRPVVTPHQEGDGNGDASSSLHIWHVGFVAVRAYFRAVTETLITLAGYTSPAALLFSHWNRMLTSIASPAAKGFWNRAIRDPLYLLHCYIQ